MSDRTRMAAQPSPKRLFTTPVPIESSYTYNAGVDLAANHHCRLLVAAAHAVTGLRPFKPALHPMPTKSIRWQLTRKPKCLTNMAVKPGSINPVEEIQHSISTSEGLTPSCPNTLELPLTHVQSAFAMFYQQLSLGLIGNTVIAFR